MFGIFTSDTTPKWKTIDDTEISLADFRVAPVDEPMREALTQSLDRPLLSVRPHKDNGGIRAMDEVLDSLPKATTQSKTSLLRRRSKRLNQSGAHAFEIRYARPIESRMGDERLLTLQYIPATGTTDSFQDQLHTYYPDSQIKRHNPETIPSAPLLPVDDQDHPEKDRYVAATTLTLRRYDLFPIKNIELEGFRTDPLAGVVSEMTDSGRDRTAADADMSIQIMFRPAHREWRQGVDDGPSIYTMSDQLTSNSFERKWRRFTKETVTIKPTTVDKKVAKLLEEQQGMRGWEIVIRILAISTDKEVARSRCLRTASMWDNYYESSSEQTFRAVPLSEREIRETVTAATIRDWASVDKASTMTKAQREVIGILNIPKEADIQSNRMQWALSKPGMGVPPGTPRFDYAKHGVADASLEEQQIAMFAAGDPTTMIWVGRGVKHGVEAGIDPEQLDTHMLISGRTGTGKSTYTEHVTSQLTERVAVALDHARQGYGGVINDPKGDDADDFIREWPEDRREEDLVVMDLGRNPADEPYENIPQYNFLQIPEGTDPNTRLGHSMIEAMADAVCGLVADAGGTDNYIGSLMKRVTKTVCRGMLQSGRSVSLLDLACAISSHEGLEQFSEWMDAERITFIRETARRQAETKTDESLDPLAGRMDEWIHNRSVRDLICARDPTFSLYELVQEGKWLVIRFPEWAGTTEKQLLSTSMILGTYFNKRACPNDDPFYMVCDEFDEVVTENSNLHIILSKGRAHNYRCILACQAPGDQFPDDHPVHSAVANNVKTHIAFNAGGKDNAQFLAAQHTVDWSTLNETDNHEFYMRVDTPRGQTDSFLVHGFKPIRDALDEVTGKPGRSDDEVEALKLRSMEQYGAPIKSAEEQQEEAYFTGGTSPIGGQRSDEPNEDRALVETLCCKAGYDEAIHATRDEFLNALIDMGEQPDLCETWVDADPVYDRFIRYLRDPFPNAAENTTRQQFDSLLEMTSGIDVKEDNETTQLRCREKAINQIKGSGDHQTAGGFGHRDLLRKAYEPLTRLGLEVAIPEQTGGRDVDAIGRIRESLPERDLVERGECSAREYANARAEFVEEQPRLAALTDGDDVTIEAEKTTSKTPGKTCRNLAKAHAQGQKCIFIVPEDFAMRVYNALTDPPYVNWDDGERARLYNVNTFTIDGETPLRPNTSSQTHWHLDHETGELVLMDGDDGAELARFADREAVETSLTAYPAHTGEVDEATVGQHGDWRPVKAPFDPREFGTEWPTEDDWVILPVGDVVETLSPLDVEEHTTTETTDDTSSDHKTEPATNGSDAQSDNLYIDFG